MDSTKILNPKIEKSIRKLKIKSKLSLVDLLQLSNPHSLINYIETNNEELKLKIQLIWSELLLNIRLKENINQK